MPKHLGSGTFGDVFKGKDNTAIKNFHKLHHCIQEYCAAKYLEDCEYVVKCNGVDFKEMRMYYELHKMNMREWMDKPRRTQREKIFLLRDVIFSLIELHSRNLVHSDLKPSNVLVSFTSSGYRATLCDLGFVANPPYSKVRRTAATFRDTNPKSHYGHDIYSLCVILMEIFYNIRVKEQLDYVEFERLIKQYAKDPSMRELMLRMIDTDHDQRPTSSEVLELLYGERFVPKIKSTIPFHVKDIHDKKYRSITSIVTEAGKIFKIHRTDVAQEIAIYCIEKYNVMEKYHQLIILCTLIIFSSVLGNSGFTDVTAMKVCDNKYTKTELTTVLKYMTNDRDILCKLFSM